MGKGTKKVPFLISHTYPTMMKLGNVIPYTKIKKIYKSRQAPLEFSLYQHFFNEDQQQYLPFQI